MNRLLRVLGAVPGYPLRPFIIGLLWFTLVCAVTATALFFAPVEPFWWIVPACFVASCLFSLAVIALISRPFVRDIDAIRENHLVHWVYAADEWARFEEAAWQRETRDVRMYPIFGLVIALVVAALAYIGSRDPLVTLGAFGLFAGIGLLVTLQTWGMARWRYMRRHRAAGDVYISTTGVLQPRGYLPYSGFNLKLTIAEVEPGDPDTLRMQVSSYTEDAITRSSDIRIPVPYGREDEAREVAQQLLGISAARRYEPVKPSR
ncbi:MAG TPA: hypothetical protein VEX37_03300 [Thermomicrobiales bacterium]|nr:hypothetical protein [Thermomicrobiales bacterium]